MLSDDTKSQVPNAGSQNSVGRDAHPIRQEGINADMLRSNGGWCYPIAVRATPAHSTDAPGRCDIQSDLAKIGTKLSNQLTMDLATAYHLGQDPLDHSARDHSWRIGELWTDRIALCSIPSMGIWRRIQEEAVDWKVREGSSKSSGSTFRRMHFSSIWSDNNCHGYAFG